MTSTPASDVHGNAESRGLCSYGCGYRARFTVGSETRFYDACARHLAHFTTRLIEETPDDDWFKIAEYDDAD